MKDYSLKSGERYPTLDLNLIGGDHRLRYEYVISKMRGSNTRLFGGDVFCGSGYGAALMARSLNASILAIDGSAEAIETATQKLPDPNIIWSAKLFPFELPHACFDFMVSMESIEHVKDYDSFFWMLAKSVKPGGRLFVSTPNEDVLPYEGYKWHYRHFQPSEVLDLAKKYGMKTVNTFSTSAQGYKAGKSCVYYPYQMRPSQPLDIGTGDISIFEFEKIA